MPSFFEFIGQSVLAVGGYIVVVLLIATTVTWLRAKFGPKDDPVFHCTVYLNHKAGSCAHVDGPLCDFATCSTRLKKSFPESFGDAIEEQCKMLPAQYGQQHRQTVPPGFTLVQENPDMAVDFRFGPGQHWLYKRTPQKDGWLPIRQLEPWEVMQAEDQRDDGIILQGKPA